MTASLGESNQPEPQLRYQEHTRSIRNNNPTSAYALYILQNRHEYGPMNTTINILKHLSTPSLLIPHELYFIQFFHKEKLISERNPVRPTLFHNWPLTHPTNPQFEKPV